MKENLNSDKIVWSDSAIEELRQRLSDPTIIDDIETYEPLVPDDLVGEIEDYYPGDEEGNGDYGDADPTGSTGEVFPAVPPIDIHVDFPWPITIKSNTVWYGADMKSNDDVTLTWDDVPGVTDYEVRITRT